MSHNVIVDEQRNHTKGLSPLLCSLSELDRSYERCRSLGISVELTKPRIYIAGTAYDIRIDANWFLISAVERILRPSLVSLPERIKFVLCDRQLTVLEILPGSEDSPAGKELGIALGAC